jgi:hypothetical protein
MTDGLDSHDFVYVRTDIPPGVRIRDRRAQRAARRPAPTRLPLLAAGRTKTVDSPAGGVPRSLSGHG